MMYSKSLLVTLMVSLRVCTSQFGWGPQTDPLSLWRFYSSAGFAPEEPLWNMDQGGTYMYVPGVPLEMLPRVKKGDRLSRMSNRNMIIAKRTTKLEAHAKNEYMTQLNKILRDYYNVTDPQPVLQKIYQLSPSWNYLGFPIKIELGRRSETRIPKTFETFARRT